MNISKLTKITPNIISVGSYPDILQSIIDFDYLSDKDAPSLVGMVGSGRKHERYFWGKDEILVPVYTSLTEIPDQVKKKINLFLNMSSGRRALSTTGKIVNFFPSLLGGAIFAENVPEKHSLELYKVATKKEVFIIGPASVGLLIPRVLKLGAIGGTQLEQLADTHLFERGNIAVLSASGGMTNEIINILAQNKKGLSFSLSFGGDRFPVLTPKEAFLIAEEDPRTHYIVYFGELGGYDEYEIADLIKSNKVTKKVIAYVAGSIAQMFATPPQFGHAKAMAERKEETARAKTEALKKAGAAVASSFSEFIDLLKQLPGGVKNKKDVTIKAKTMLSRKHALFTNTVSEETDGEVRVLGEDLNHLAKRHSFAFIVSSLLLGRKIKSHEMEEFTDLVLKLLVDHGPSVSGAVNTMITARAGKDLVSSLVSGLLTIGPRFGGAINDAARNWFDARNTNMNPSNFVESFAQKGDYIPGIGHKKYSVDNPDPRVLEILKFVNGLTGQYTKFVKGVEKITTSKKGNLILNVDGAIAAVMLDLLCEKEKLSKENITELLDTEFFNALFVLSRAVGFTAYYIDQKRIGEGLFRLPKEEVASIRRV